MPFDANGVWTRPQDPVTGSEYSFVADKTAGRPRALVEAEDHDAHWNDLKSALSLCLLHDGRRALTGNLNVNEHELTNARRINTPTAADLAFRGGAEDRVSVAYNGYRLNVLGGTTEVAELNLGFGRAGDGIGRLDFYAATSNYVGARIQRWGGTNANFRFEQFGTSALQFFAHGDGVIQFFGASAAERFRITSSALLSYVSVFHLRPPTPAALASFQIGQGRTGDGSSIVDLIGDATYTSFGLRLLRNGGANGNSDIIHRGIGSLQLVAQEAGTVKLFTSNTARMTVNSDASITMNSGVFLYGNNLTSGAGNLGVGGNPTDGAVLGDVFLNIQRGNGSNISLSKPAGSSVFTYVNLVHQDVSAGTIVLDPNTDTVTYNTTSDERRKNILGPLDAMETLLALEPIEFIWKNDRKRQRVAGFSAQRTNKVFPQAVTYLEKQDVWQMDNHHIVPLLVSGWQGHDARIARIEQELGLQ